MTSGEDWRVQVRLGDRGKAADVARQLARGELEHRLETAAGERVIVSHDGDELFLYAGTRAQAQAAADAVTALAPNATTQLRRWHPVAEEWEDPDAPLPDDGTTSGPEWDERMARERAESAQTPRAELEVRVQLPSHHDTRELAERLASEGIPSLRRWRFLLVGAEDEQAAQQLADRIRTELPAGGTVSVEGTAAEALAEMPMSPFVVFGGLGI